MSWYPKTKINKETFTYLKLLQEIFKVKNDKEEWVPYKLQPHQIHWHSEDVAVKGREAKIRVVVKSRNTSFTTSSIISLIMSIPKYSKQIKPVLRLNQTRANDLIDEIKEIIRHMTPIKLPNGKLFPFNPAEVEMDKIGSITFPNGTEIRAFPANAKSAESIRGLRISGHAGIIDESNFMSDFNKIYIAMRDTKAGKNADFQFDIGTTLKGETPFSIWFEKIKENAEKIGIIIFNWPVFDPTKIDLEKPLTEQNAIPIVPWHDVMELEQKRLEDINTFKEEFMAIKVDSEEAFYKTAQVLKSVDTELKNYQSPPHNGEYYVGVDPAAEGNDFFAVSIFEKIDEKYVQRHLYYEKKSDLKEMEDYISALIEVWQPVRVRIDANMLGYQLGQQLKKKYPEIVELIRGSIRIRSSKNDIPVSLKEYIHTEQKRLMIQGKLSLINDELQIIQYSFWNYKFDCPHTREYGHGDCVIANGLALFEENSASEPLVSNLDVREKINQKHSTNYTDWPLQKKIEWLKNMKK